MSETVTVRFPDGNHEVPSRPRFQTIQPTGAEPQVVDLGHEPVPNAEWEFKEALDGSWSAHKR